MVYFVTRVPTNWSPNTTYQLTSKLTLKPAGRRAYTDYPGLGATLYFDTVSFISNSQNLEEHILELRHWVLFHAFIFDFHHLCSIFENGLLDDYRLSNTVDMIQEPVEGNANEKNFDNIANEVYFFHKPPFAVSYSSLFEKYQRLTEDHLRLLRGYLFQVETRRAYSLQFALFEDMRRYWQITNYISLIEAAIGNAPNCSHGEKMTCPSCTKKLTHRQSSDKKWRETYLSSLGLPESIRNSYLQVIGDAYGKVRSATAHANRMGTPEYPDVRGTEVYTVSRAIDEFGTDMYALDSLSGLVMYIARYLLLYKLFDLSFFPELVDFKVTHIGGEEMIL